MLIHYVLTNKINDFFNAVKVDCNSWVNPIHHGFELDWVWKKYNFFMQVNFQPSSIKTRAHRIELVVS